MRENMRRAARFLSPFLFGAVAFAGAAHADQPRTRDELLSAARACWARKEYDAA